jgi:hypothetical protein
MESKYRQFLGDKFQNVEDFAKALGPIEKAAFIARGTGMMVKGESIGELADAFQPKPGKILKSVAAMVPGWMGWKAVAKMILSGPVRTWSAKSTASDIPQLLKAAILSEPVLAELASNAGGRVGDYANSARHYFNSSGASVTNQPAQKATGKNASDFLNAP